MIDPADAHQLDQLLRRHRIDLKHSLGQNFLTDPGVRDAVAEQAALESTDQVLEVGAGVGTLTVALAPRCRRVVAVELDGRLIPALRESLAGLENVEQVTQLFGFVLSAEGFGDQPKVLNGASDLLVDVFGEAGRHTRLALGTNALPFSVTVEIAAVAVVRTR